MNLQRFEPFGLINALNRDLDRFATRRLAAPDTDWRPAVDIVEEDERFLVRADLPGVATDDIDVQMENGLLTVAGERRRERADDADGVRRYERRVGRFARRFTLPESADAERITARSVNGTLEITIPKQPENAARRIAVEAA